MRGGDGGGKGIGEADMSGQGRERAEKRELSGEMEDEGGRERETLSESDKSH